MLRTKELITILLVCVFCFSYAHADEQKTRTVKIRNPKTSELISKQVPIHQEQADPYEDTSVLVEAFVVEIPTEALVDAGVSPIGQAPEGVSILKILWCIKDEDLGRVVSGSKLMAKHNSRAEMSNRDITYIKTEKTVVRKTDDGPKEFTDVRFDDYACGIEFRATPTVLENAIRVYYEYSQSGFKESDDKTIPPDRYSFNWEGTLTVASGRPVIAGGLQDEDAVTFLILTATVQNLQDNDSDIE